MPDQAIKLGQLPNLTEARFVERHSRVSAWIERPGHPPEKAHLTNTGKLLDILQPGARLLVMPIQAPKTRFRIIGSHVQDHLWTLLDTRTQEQVVEHLLQTRQIPGWESWTFVRRQPRHHSHIFDFLVQDEQGSPRFLEVKSAVFYFTHDQSARYPDTITSRAHRQLDYFLHHPEQAALLFVAAHPLAQIFRPSLNDPEVAQRIMKLKEIGIPIRATRIWIDSHGNIYLAPRPLPIHPPA